MLAANKVRFKTIGNSFCLGLKFLLMTRFCDFARQAYFSIRHKGKDFARAFLFFLLYWASVVALSERPILRTIPHYNVLIVTVNKVL